ncbi:MAG: hypothetical protein GVY24_03820 [Planctomycetes bacterium]|nr:hypothetical protein [Planctomycetota bacterium]
MDRSSRTRMLLAGVWLALGTLAAGGCADPLFPENMPRSPYDRYLALRGQSRPEVELDVNGREKPALRRRLAPLDTP